MTTKEILLTNVNVDNLDKSITIRQLIELLEPSTIHTAKHFIPDGVLEDVKVIAFKTLAAQINSHFAVTGISKDTPEETVTFHTPIFKETEVPIEFLFETPMNKDAKYATEGSAAMDVKVDITQTELDINQTARIIPDPDYTSALRVYPGATVLMDLGFRVAIPEGYELQVFPRSGLSVKGITVANSPGLIDSDYRGKVKVIIRNDGNTFYDFKQGERIAQIKVVKSLRIKMIEVTQLSETKRGEGGFGHSGRV